MSTEVAERSLILAELVDARLWYGIHFRRADEAGVRIGMQVANWPQLHSFGSMSGEGDPDDDGGDD